MPKIPTYDSPQVEERALPGARQSSVASPSLFGAQAEQNMQNSKALMNAGTMLSDVAVKMQERENADMLFRAETTLKDAYLKHEQNIRQRKGVNAWGTLADTEQFFTEQEKKHSQSLQNDKQRYLFSQGLTKLRQSAMGAMAQYENAERTRSLDESARASIVGSINMAASVAAEDMAVPGATDAPNPIAGIKKDVINRVQVLAGVNGWSPERKAAEEAQHLTNLHKQVIQSMVDRDPATAREYFKANKAEINGSELDTIQKVLKIGEMRGTVQRSADALMNAVNDNPGVTEEGVLKQIRTDFSDNPEMRDAITTEFKSRMTERRQMREAGQKDLADQAWKAYAQTGRFDAIPSSVIAGMDGRDIEAMRTHARGKAEGVAVKTNPAVWLDVHSQIVAGGKVDLRRHINELAPSDIKDLEKLQTSESDRLDAATLSQQLSVAHNEMNWGSGDKDKKGAFDKAVNQTVSAEQKRLGKKLDDTARQAIIDKMLIKRDNGFFQFGDQQYFEVRGTDKAADFVPTAESLPKADRDTIVTRFRKLMGKEPTEAELVQTYKKWKGL